MTASELIQILMRNENIDKDIEIVNSRDGRVSFQVDEVRDVSSVIELVVDLGDDLLEMDCSCSCDVCEECLGA